MHKYFYLLSVLLWATAGNCAALFSSLLPSTDQCGRINEVFPPGYSYSFTYKLTKFKFSTESPDDHYLGIFCNVELQAFSTCQYVLRTKNCALSKTSKDLHEKSSIFSKQMEKYSVLFNGYESISASVNEDTALLNLKRGIISTIYSGSVYLEKGSLPKTIAKPDLQGIRNVTYKSSWEDGQLVIHSRKGYESTYFEDEECKAYFDENKKFSHIFCDEGSRINSSIKFYTRYARELRFKEQLPLSEINANYLSNFKLTNLTYEEPTELKAEDLHKTIIQRIKDLLSFSDNPIESETFWSFHSLADDLRRTTNLAATGKGFSNCWGSVSCSKESQTRIGHIWRDALVRCDTVQCIEEFKNFVKQYTNTLPDVLNNDIMNDVYLHWFDEDFYDPKFIENIYEICQFRNQTVCYLSVAAKIQYYWINNKNKLTVSNAISNIVQKVIEPINRCKTLTSSDHEVLRSLQMLSNIGQIAKVVNGKVINLLHECAISSSIDWTISLAAVEAFEKFEADKPLYQHLLNIIKSPSLSLKHRVVGYHIIIDHYNEKAAEDIQQILMSNGTDSNFKTYIYSHIKAVLRAQDYSKKELTKAFSKIVDENPAEFFSYNSDGKLVSKYLETNFYYVPKTSNSKWLFGMEDHFSFINDGDSFIPSSAVETLKVIFEGKKYDFSKLAIYSKGFVGLLTSILENFSKRGSVMAPIMKFGYPDSGLNDLLSKVDKNVVDKLQKIINAIPTHDTASLLSELGIFGEKVWYGNAKYPPWTLNILNSILIPETIPSLYRKQSKLFKIKDITVTTGGLPIEFRIDADLILSWDHKKDAKQDFSQNAYTVSHHLSTRTAVNLRVGYGTELPGYERLGCIYEALVSGSSNLIGKFNANGAKRSTKLSLELPHNSKQAFSFSLQKVSWKDNIWTPMPKEENMTFKKCTKLAGTSFCKSDYSILPQIFSTTEIFTPVDYPVSLQLEFSTVPSDADAWNATFSIFASEGYARFRDVIRVKHLFNHERDYREIDIDSDVLDGFKLSIDLEDVETDNSSISVSGTLAPGYSFDYYNKEFTPKSTSELTKYSTPYLLKNRIVRRGETVHCKEKTFNCVTPFGTLTTSSSEQQFPVNYYADAAIQFKFVEEYYGQSVAQMLPVSAIWEDSKTMKLDIHYEKDAFLSNLIYTIPENSAELKFLFPKYSIEAKYDKSLQDDLSSYSSLNITSKSLPDETTDLSYRFGLHRNNSYEKDYNKNLVVATFSIPHLLWRFTCEKIFYKVPKYSHIWKLERLVNSNDNVHDAQSPFYIMMKNSPPSHDEINFSFLNDSTATSGPSIIDINLGSKGIITRNVNLHFDVISKYPKHVAYKVNLTDYNRILYGIYRHDYLAAIDNHLTLVDNQNNTIFDYTNDLTCNHQKKYVKYNSNFDSNVFTSKNYLKWDFSDKYSAFDLNISTHSREWNFATFDLKQHVSGDINKMKLKHIWADVEVDTSSFKKYQKTISITSKTDLIPTSRWIIECVSEHHCVAVANFRIRNYSKMYIIYHVSPGATEASLTVCRNKICQDPETDPDNFVIKSMVNLIDRRTLVHTVVSDPQLPEKVNKIIADWIVMFFMTASPMANPQHPVHKIYKYFVGRSIAESKDRVTLVAMQLSQIAITDLTATFMPPVAPVISMVNAARASRRSQRDTYGILSADYFRNLQSASKKSIGAFVNRIGPFVGFSKVYDVEYLWPFKNITHFDFTINHALMKYFFETNGDGQVQIDNYYDEDYPRIALVIGPKIVSPFEGGLVIIENPDCPQLLTYDVEHKMFVVYKESNWIYFVFSDTVLKLSYNSGEFYVNSKLSEFPYEHHSKAVTVERQSNLIYILTDYAFDIECDIDNYFCVLYTEIWTFGKLHGLLGKNIDIVDAQKQYGAIKDPDRFLLTEDSSCKNGKLYSMTPTTDNNKICKEFFDLATVSATLHKYNTLDPAHYYEECINQPQYSKSIISAYLAAAAALKSAVDFDYSLNSLCGNHQIGDEWKGKWNQKKLDVIFVIDLSLNPDLRDTYSISLSKLAFQIQQDFAKESFYDIKFGLFSFRGDLETPYQFTMNDKVWGTAEQFSNQGLRHLFSQKSTTKTEQNSTEVFDALLHALAVTHFTDNAVRMMYLVTPNDTFDYITVNNLYNTLDSLNSDHVSLYSISNYKELPPGTYGITGTDDTDRYIPSNKKAKILKGHGARLVKATNGASWSLRYLENDENQKEFLSAVSSTMIDRCSAYLDSDIHYHCAISPMGIAYPYSEVD